MSQLEEILTPEPAPAAPATVAGQNRRRWLTAAIAGLLVVLYLVVWVIYTKVHLPPQRYEQQPPGATATKQGADFTLVGLSQSPVLVGKYDDTAQASAGAVWVVARLEVTRRTASEYFTCQFVLVGTDGRTWESESPLAVSRDLEGCSADETPFDRATPIETVFEIPVVDADRIAGLAVPQGTADRDPVLTVSR